LTPFYEAIAWLVVHIHQVISPVLGKTNGWSWALSIVLLTIAMRLLLFPLFVKQIRNQRAMQTLQPKMKELQAK
jgi:YidC/Oxa1 family membrane protein insertase